MYYNITDYNYFNPSPTYLGRYIPQLQILFPRFNIPFIEKKLGNGECSDTFLQISHHLRLLCLTEGHNAESSVRIDISMHPFSSGSSQPRNRTGVSCIAGRFFTNWAIREAPYSVGKTMLPHMKLVWHSTAWGYLVVTCDHSRNTNLTEYHIRPITSLLALS